MTDGSKGRSLAGEAMGYASGRFYVVDDVSAKLIYDVNDINSFAGACRQQRSSLFMAMELVARLEVTKRDDFFARI